MRIEALACMLKLINHFLITVINTDAIYYYFVVLNLEFYTFSVPADNKKPF